MLRALIVYVTSKHAQHEQSLLGPSKSYCLSLAFGVLLVGAYGLGLICSNLKTYPLSVLRVRWLDSGIPGDTTGPVGLVSFGFTVPLRRFNSQECAFHNEVLLLNEVQPQKSALPNRKS